MENTPQASPRSEVSWGELFDKISILKIKEERITTRVHLAMRYLLDSLSEDESKLAIERLLESAGRESLAVLARHAEPTRLGKAILHELEDY